MLRELLIYFSAYIGLFGVIFYTLSLISKRHLKHPEFPEKNPPYVSIIVPAWNEEMGIVGTIKSILNIDYPKNKLEVIVVDDGSSDNTFSVAKRYESEMVRVYKMDKNSGKFAALNFGIGKSRGEIIVTTDADNLFVNTDALKNMIAYFDNPRIMCVAPVMAIHKPRGILQRIQQVEYLLGVFLRKAFSSMNAIHITPGAFSAYRKIFFEEYGGFEKAHLTEDLEMSLRIQKHHYLIENSLKSVVYTVAPNKFGVLLKQRRRWFTGLIKNLWDYRLLFSRKYGLLGVVVLPIAITTVVMSVILTVYLVITSLIQLKEELIFLKSVNFDVFNSFQWNSYIIDRYIFLLFSSPVVILSIIFISILIGYMYFAKRHVKEHSDIGISVIFFLIFYSLLFSLWWIVSFAYTIFNRKVSWR